MKIVISGYGKMGREVERAALERGHEIAARCDRPEDWVQMAAEISAGDVAIEFSTPSSAADNIRRCFDLRLPVVAGTTGWNDRAATVRQWCMEEGQALFTAANFSIGVNILFRLAGELAPYLDRFGAYDISLEETHRVHKLDSPSGTAIRIAEIILERSGRKKLWVNRETPNSDELQIRSFRTGEVPGTHIVRFSSENDTLSLVHEAHSRKGFAVGAVLAAEWLQGRTGFFTMEDMLGL